MRGERSHVSRRSLLGAGVFGGVASLFPEVASAAKLLKRDTEVDWFDGGDQRVRATEQVRIEYLPYFEAGLSRMESLFGDRPEDADGIIVATAQRGRRLIVSLSTCLGNKYYYIAHRELEAGRVRRVHEVIYEHRPETDSLEIVDVAGTHSARLAGNTAEPNACPIATCRTCKSVNVSAVLLCCGGCGWAGGVPAALLSCALIMCSACANANCTRWESYCCQVGV